jgi:hypothetical protein
MWKPVALKDASSIPEIATRSSASAEPSGTSDTVRCHRLRPDTEFATEAAAA